MYRNFGTSWLCNAISKFVIEVWPISQLLSWESILAFGSKIDIYSVKKHLYYTKTSVKIVGPKNVANDLNINLVNWCKMVLECKPKHNREALNGFPDFLAWADWLQITNVLSEMSYQFE